MKKIIAIALLLLCGLNATLHASTNPVEDLRIAVTRDAAVFEVHTNYGDGLKALDDAKRGQSNLDALISPAVAAAQSHPDLVAAIKAFYVSAKTYFDSASTPVGLPDYDIRFGSRPSLEATAHTAVQAKLKADLDSKANALKLEVQLAGL